MIDSKEIIKLLRINAPYEAPRCLHAADRIEMQETEVKELLDALARFGVYPDPPKRGDA